MGAAFYNRISAKTRLCAVLGSPIRHSASPAMHNAAFEAVGLDWRYVALEVDPSHLGAAIEGARRMGFIGLNLTVPHKIHALTLVDHVDSEAAEWGAINTIRFEGRLSGEWQCVADFETTPAEPRSHGFNTDVEAIARSIREDLQVGLKGARVLLLGAGGAGRAAALKLASGGVKALYLVNRTEAKAMQVRKEIQTRFPEVSVFVGYPDEAIDLAINATSLGLKSDDGLPLDTRAFPFEKVAKVYDMVYRPAETRFTAEARAAGCSVANGLGMLLYQGAAAFEIWTGRRAPLDIMRKALKEEIYG